MLADKDGIILSFSMYGTMDDYFTVANGKYEFTYTYDLTQEFTDVKEASVFLKTQEMNTSLTNYLYTKEDANNDDLLMIANKLRMVLLNYEMVSK